MSIADLLEQALSGAHGVVTFDRKLASLLDDVDNADPMVQARLVASAITFAALCLARHAMWHVEDHNDIDCARDITHASVLGFVDAAIGRCKEIAEGRGLTDPFAASDVNTSLIKEMLNEIDS